MSTIRRYFAREIYKASAFTMVAFLALFAFFDMVNELGELGIGGYRLRHAFAFVLLSIPGHVYELFPVAVLVGTLVALSTLAANSEYTVMRVSGLAPLDAVRMLARVGSAFVILTIIVGEFAAPAAERAAKELRMDRLGSAMSSGLRTGVWLRSDGQFVNVREVLPDSSLRGVRIYDFDGNLRLVSLSEAARGTYEGSNVWRLSDVTRTEFEGDRAVVRKAADTDWRSVLTPDILGALLVRPEKMSAWNLYQYIRLLSQNHQRTERQEIALWQKVIYPFATLVMMALALPFAYVQIRTSGLGLKLFAGIVLGILFHFLNNLGTTLGVLQTWTPFVSAAAPSILFLITAAAMMWWVERR
ncbi:MAG: LPS export ABC transporter permease LptG [Burkholderiales bacterium]|nr:LPS export ABC transporter permease LptG [Burkholderiales bacterium]